MNTTVLSKLTGITTVNPKDIINRGYNGSTSATAGCLIKTQSVYSICMGTDLAVGKNPTTSAWCVTVEVDSQRWIRYCNLSVTNVLVGANLKDNDFIGYAYNNLMQFEYCTSTKSKFPVRALTYQLYKNDPTPILFGQINLSGVI